jgi:translation initiation factor RLI1
MPDNSKPRELESDEHHSVGSASSVGYGKPPSNTRFRRGVSGNPKGRPKGSRNVASVFAKTLREKVVINEHGQRKTITKLEAAIKQFVNKAAGGDLRALQMLVSLSREAETRELSQPERSIIAEVDQRVMESIVRRFQPANQIEGEEANDKPEC